jgi:hypothetical protein
MVFFAMRALEFEFVLNPPRFRQRYTTHMRTGQFAEEVREYALKNYIEPARAAKAPSVQIRASDNHKALNFHARLPRICSGLTAMSFHRGTTFDR